MSFVARLRSIVEAQYLDDRFDVAILAREAGLSYSQMARKIRAETGQTPTHLIRTVRLERAAEMIQNGATNMTEVAHAVGFGSLSYFSRCFKAHYGVPPSRFPGP